jgi:hypothetical protein
MLIQDDAELDLGESDLLEQSSSIIAIDDRLKSYLVSKGATSNNQRLNPLIYSSRNVPQRLKQQPLPTNKTENDK